jgi:phosphoglycerol transferase
MPSDAPTPSGGIVLDPDPTPTPAATASESEGAAPAPRSRPRWMYEARDGAIVAATSALITAWLFKIWEIPLRLPFLYQRDGIAQVAEVKGIIENGWYQYNPRVGWPIGYDHHDFPIGSDNLHYVALKVMGWFSHDPVLVVNAYYLLSFLLVALSAFYVIRYLGVSRRFSFVAALLYTFLPYHFLRGTWHLMLSAYYMVPVACLFTILVWRHAPPFFRAVDGPDDEETGETKVRFEWKRWSTLWLVLACFAIASTDVYYAAFCIVLMLTAGVLQLVTVRNWRSLVSGLALTAIIGVGLLVNLSPSLLYWREHGTNEHVVQRTVAESDFYALRPIQMLSPIPGYRISTINDEIVKEVFTAPDNSEATQFLGAIGAVGFLGLMIVLLGLGFTRDRDRSPPLPFELAALCALAVLFGVTGGLSWTFGLAGFTEIRSWNRISIFIAFYSLLAVGLALDWLVRRTREFSYKPLVVSGAAVLLVLIGVFDQSSGAIIPSSVGNEAQWNSDAVFVKQIEQTLGAGGKVFQLPYLPFPEAELSVPPYGMVDYDPLRGYLHSDDLYWGYGGTRGRAADWQAQVVKHATPKMLDAITAVGFDGLWIDTLGYPNHAEKIIAEVEAATGEKPITSPNGRFVFFDLRAYQQDVEQRLGGSGVQALKERTLRDVR